MTGAMMPKDLNMAELAANLADPKGEAGKRFLRHLEAERTERGQARQKRIHLKPTPREVVSALTAGRQVARDARAYANDWYQALRSWKTEEPKIWNGRYYYDDGPPPDVLLVGSNKPLPTVYLHTPAGEFEERSVGQIITEMARHGTTETQQLGKMLDRLRHEPDNCMVTLLRQDGRWERNRERAVRYAVAVLTLAVQLRVAEAEAPLLLMRRELASLTN